MPQNQNAIHIYLRQSAFYRLTRILYTLAQFSAIFSFECSYQTGLIWIVRSNNLSIVNFQRSHLGFSQSDTSAHSLTNISLICLIFAHTLSAKGDVSYEEPR